MADIAKIKENANKIAEFDAADTYLEMGSLVKLKDKRTIYMIIGRWYNGSNGQNYDYMGVAYPVGFLSNRLTAMFNKADIEAVLREAEKTPISIAQTKYLTELQAVIKGEKSEFFESLKDSVVGIVDLPEETTEE